MDEHILAMLGANLTEGLISSGGCALGNASSGGLGCVNLTLTSLCPQCFPAYEEENVSVITRWVLGALYLVIMLVCGVGNALLLAVLARFREARTTTNLLIGNLALSDWLVAVFRLPFAFDYYVVRSRSWQFGDFMCGAVNYLNSVSLYVSTHALLVISVDRFMVVRQSGIMRATRRRLFPIFSAVWISAILLAIPSAVFSKTAEFLNGDIFCGVSFPVWHRPLYQGLTVVLFVAEYVLPVCLMCACYAYIGYRVCNRRFPGHRNESQDRSRRRSRRRTVRLIVLVAAFIVCWGPLYSFTLIRDFSYDLISHVSHSTAILYVLDGLAMSNSVISTAVYVFANENVMKHVYSLLNRVSLGRLWKRSDRGQPRSPNTASAQRVCVFPPATSSAPISPQERQTRNTNVPELKTTSV
ncbi:PROKR2 [Branchiostoma lanceolatum]|uniref:PROKR2 protein n=1 Tax=Branchiostoma lanceolatum TaxID=7740 RepID=A0A8K0AEZ8_BRALA|nr:PROKR2 [Branchiostoma lanceolatum]